MNTEKSGEFKTWPSMTTDSYSDYCEHDKIVAALTRDEWMEVRNDPEFAYWLDESSPNFRAGQRPKEWWLYESREPRNRLEGEVQQLLRMNELTPAERRFFGLE
ncbi:MAG: hypothetical protein PHC51_05240 [bacterium]|nr:hypothetical protein [bacterium]